MSFSAVHVTEGVAADLPTSSPGTGGLYLHWPQCPQVRCVVYKENTDRWQAFHVPITACSGEDIQIENDREYDSIW